MRCGLAGCVDLLFRYFVEVYFLTSAVLYKVSFFSTIVALPLGSFLGSIKFYRSSVSCLSIHCTRGLSVFRGVGLEARVFWLLGLIAMSALFFLLAFVELVINVYSYSNVVRKYSRSVFLN